MPFAAMRLRQPTPPSGGKVGSLLHFDGPNGSTVFTDESGKVWTPSGACQISTTDPKIGASCGLFSGGRITTPATDTLAFGTGDFTIAFWIKTSQNVAGGAGVARVIGAGSGANNAPGTLQVWRNDATSTYGTVNGITIADPTGATDYVSDVNVAINDGVWHHIQFCRQSGVAYAFLDGVLKTTRASTHNLNRPAADGLSIGNGPSGIAALASIDELLLLKGVALNTTNFTPPTAPYSWP